LVPLRRSGPLRCSKSQASMATADFQGRSVNCIQYGDHSVAIFLAEKGRLLSWTVHGKAIFYWPDQTNWGNVPKTRGGNPILFPFIARHMVDGVAGTWKNDKGEVFDMPVHGFAREADWENVPTKDASSIRFRLRETEATLKVYPFRFLFDVTYSLVSELDMEVRFEVTNTGDVPMPYYAGHHFYFAVPKTERAKWNLTLPFPTQGWQNPDGSVSFEDLAGPPPLVTTFADSSIQDKYHVPLNPAQEPSKPVDCSNAVVIFEQPEEKKIIRVVMGPTSATASSHPSLAPWYCVTTWTESAASDFYCVEPWLGLPNAIHHGHGLRSIAPGMKETAVCSISVTV